MPIRGILTLLRKQMAVVIILNSIFPFCNYKLYDIIYQEIVKTLPWLLGMNIVCIYYTAITLAGCGNHAPDL